MDYLRFLPVLRQRTSGFCHETFPPILPHHKRKKGRLFNRVVRLVYLCFKPKTRLIHNSSFGV
jgi:hypothetical protein